jgi:oxygen-independent coproporphyrinogen III oxidase
MTELMPNVTGLYAHIPFCDGKCAYCAFYSILYDPALADRYLAAIERELQLLLSRECCSGGSASRSSSVPENAAKMRKASIPKPLNRRLNAVKADFPWRPATVYFGGGTPSMLSAVQLQKLCRMVRERLSLDRLAEWSMEVNPGSLTAEKAEILAAAGVNRVSIGAQSFDDTVLKQLGRRHATGEIEDAVAILRQAGLDNFGLDLIACVPGASRERWRATLLKAIALEPEHVSVYALTDEEGTRLHQAIGQGSAALLSDDDQLAMLDMAEALLAQAGLRRYEISNYARPGFECRHNLACWRGEEYIGLGPAAATHIGLRRWTNCSDLPAYLAALESGRTPMREAEELTPDLKQQEQLVFGLRMAEGVTEQIAAGYEDILSRLQADGLVEQCAERWKLTARGRNLADYVAVELMSGYNPAANHPANRGR